VARKKLPALTPFTRDVGQVTARHLTPSQVRKLLGPKQGTRYSARYLPTAVATGWASDGRFAYRMPDRERAKYREPVEGVALPLAEIVAGASKRCGGQHCARVVGARWNEQDARPEYHLSDGHGRQAIVNAVLYLTVVNRLDGARCYLDSDPDGPMIFRDQHGTPVGLLMPLALLTPSTVVPYEGEE